MPTRPASTVSAQPHTSWTDGTSVQYNAISGELPCSQDSHKAIKSPTLIYFPSEVAASIKNCIELQDMHFS